MGDLLFPSPPRRVAAPIVPSTTNAEAERDASLARAQQRARAGAAANVLTSPLGISGRGTTPKLGRAA